MLAFHAEIYRDGKYWLAEIPALDAMTQGKSKKNAVLMLKDWIKSALGDDGFEVIVHTRANGELCVLVEPTAEMIGLLLQRQRMLRQLTIRQAAHLLGFNSHNAYAQYERGKREPGLSMLARFMEAFDPERHFPLSIG